MLLHEQRGGHEDRHLLAVLHRLEGRTHGDLRLAVAHVATDDSVHGGGPLHVGLDLVDARHLVGGLDVGEGVLELALPLRVRPEGVAGRGLPGGVQPDQFARDLAHGAPGAALGALPVRPA